MKGYCLLSLFLFLTYLCSLKAQVIHGKVTNKLGQPLPYANIYVLDSNIGTTTNVSGDYLLKLPEKKYKVVYSYLGYKRDTLTVDLNAKKFINKDIILESLPIELNPI